MYRYAVMYCNYVFKFSTNGVYICKPEEIKNLNLNKNIVAVILLQSRQSS